MILVLINKGVIYIYKCIHINKIKSNFYIIKFVCCKKDIIKFVLLYLNYERKKEHSTSHNEKLKTIICLKNNLFTH